VVCCPASANILTTAQLTISSHNTADRPSLILRAGDTLNGHVDDAERCLAQPLVSLSLGCDAIFLMGTSSKADPPTALLLRSGDALVLSGLARQCYHGLPRILTEPEGPAPLRCRASGGSGDRGGSSQEGSSRSGDGSDSCSGSKDDAPEWDDPLLPFARHMQRCRINISIRDTR
jgi:alkylated DNA repair protein alkB family protein 1